MVYRLVRHSSKYSIGIKNSKLAKVRLRSNGVTMIYSTVEISTNFVTYVENEGKYNVGERVFHLVISN